jgi:hypothetical protein
LPVAARAAVPAASASPDEDDLRERIRLAAQRAVAVSNARETTAAKPVPEKPAAPRSAAAKPAQVSAPPPAKKAQTQPVRPRKADEPKIWVPPRAPDDPGPEIAEESDLEIGPLRPSGAKA